MTDPRDRKRKPDNDWDHSRVELPGDDDEELPPRLPSPDIFDAPTRPGGAEDFDDKTTKPISEEELAEKLTESWVGSPDDDLEITVGPADEDAPVPQRHVLTEGITLDAEDMTPAPVLEDLKPPSRRDRTATPAIPSEPLPAKFMPRPRAQAAPRVGVAIDFGTTRSSVGVVVDGRVRILPLPNGRYDILSLVGIRSDGSAVIGEVARDLQEIDPRLVLASPKRLLGRFFNDREIEAHIANLPMPAFEGPQGFITVQVHNRRYTLPQLCAPIIYHLRLVAEEHLGQKVEEVVLSAPTSFDTTRHRALAEAAALAGLRVSKFVDEPAAAALANRQDSDFKGLVGVYDFGGGTFDFSVIDVDTLKMVTTAGDTWLGGDDFDEVIGNAAANAFWRNKGVELRHQVVQWQRLLVASEIAKRELSQANEATVTLTEAALTARGPLDLLMPMTRAQFSELCQPLVERSMDTCQLALDLCELRPQQINAIYLCGGTSYIPAVQEAVARFFGRIPLISVPPEQAVVLGAACYAALPPMITSTVFS